MHNDLRRIDPLYDGRQHAERDGGDPIYGAGGGERHDHETLGALAVILDTSIIIGIRRGDTRAINAVRALREQGTTLHITAITITELASGTARSNTPLVEQQRLATILQGQHILELDQVSAEQAGNINGTLIAKGTPVGILDCMKVGSLRGSTGRYTRAEKCKRERTRFGHSCHHPPELVLFSTADRELAFRWGTGPER